MSFRAIVEEFDACLQLAESAGACESKARYFANKQILKLYGINVFDMLGMTKKSVPNSDEVLYAVCRSEVGVTPRDILMEYPFTRLTTDVVVKMLDKFEAEGLIKFDGTAYTGA